MIVPALPEHAKAEFTLPGIEIYAGIQKMTVEESIVAAISEADEAYTWLVKGGNWGECGEETREVGCVFGVKRQDFTGIAYMWLFPTPKVGQNGREFLRICKNYRKEWVKRYPIITGYCNIDFAASHKWLLWLGAAFEPAIEVHGLRLSRFYIHDAT